MMITSASLCLAGLVVLTTSGRGVDTVDVWRHGIYSQHVQVKDYSGERTASTCTVHDSAGSDWRTRSTDKPTQINVRNFKLNVNCKGNKEQAVASIRICVVHVHRVLVKITLHLAREWSQQGSLLWSLINFEQNFTRFSLFTFNIFTEPDSDSETLSSFLVGYSLTRTVEGDWLIGRRLKSYSRCFKHSFSESYRIRLASLCRSYTYTLLITVHARFRIATYLHVAPDVP